MSEQLYVWLVKVYKREWINYVGYKDILQFKKVFTSKISAINYKVNMENRGFVVTLEKYRGD